jgi:AcrR family transcriptional regulator
MADSNRTGTRLTRRGAATRNRIVEVAADLVQRHGISETTLDQVMEASGVSKSQLYHYFEDKVELLREASALQVTRVLGTQGQILEGVDSLLRFRKWTESLLLLSQGEGCPLGALVYQLPRAAKGANREVSRGMEAWRGLLENGLVAMKARGELVDEAEPAEIALAVLAAVQGGLLLSKSSKSNRPLEIALAMALEHVSQVCGTSRGSEGALRRGRTAARR